MFLIPDPERCPGRASEGPSLGLNALQTEEDENSYREPCTTRRPLWASARKSRNAGALVVNPEWDECHKASHLLSHHHLHHLNSEMKSLKSLFPPKSHRRQRSKARSEINPAEGQSEVGSAAQRPTESSPDPHPGTSTLSTPGSSAVHDQESNGVYISTIPSQTIHLRTLFA